MADTDSYARLKREIVERMAEDRSVLEQLRDEIRPLRSEVRRIQPRNTTSIALVATDGGNNSLRFDPFLVEIVRVVDSSNNELCLEVITPTTRISSLSAKQFQEDGTPCTPLGELMDYLGVRDLTKVSPYIHNNKVGKPVNPSWVRDYRALVEWAVLFSLVRKSVFGTDTLLVFDGLLRSTIFAGDLFDRYLRGIQEGIELQKQRHHRKIYLAGVAKHSKVLSRYRLAMALEGILATKYPAYLPIPDHIEKNAYRWTGYTHEDIVQTEQDETNEHKHDKVNRYVGGKMFFVKFGSGLHDPIWPVDIFSEQLSEAQSIIGSMQADAVNGFPVPSYPLCLQKAHANAALVDFDFDILQDHIFEGLRLMLAQDSPMLESFRLQDADIAQRRYR